MRVSKRIVLPVCVTALSAGAIALAGGGNPSYGPGPVYAPGPQGGSLPVTALTANLNGRREISASGRARAGDRDGRGVAQVLLRGRRQICISVLVANIGVPVAAHIHKARAGRNGGVVLPLGAPTQGGLAGSTTCAQISTGLHKKLRTQPKQYYVNVHTQAFPNGAIRGQLSKAAVGS
jgi:CHRD domain